MLTIRAPVVKILELVCIRVLNHIPKRNKCPVSNKRPPFSYQKWMSAPGVKSNVYGTHFV